MCGHSRQHIDYDYYYRSQNSKDKKKNDELDHIHYFCGNTCFAGEGKRFHNHKFYSTTGKGIPVGCGRHVHRYFDKTSIDKGHNHKMSGITGVDIKVACGKHLHLEKSETSFDFGHDHKFKFVTSTERKFTRSGCAYPY